MEQSIPNYFNSPSTIHPFFGFHNTNGSNRELKNDVLFHSSKIPFTIFKENKVDDQKVENDVKGELSFDKLMINNEEIEIGNLSIISKDLETNDKGIDLVVIMDVSGSMSNVSRECIEILNYSVDCLSSQDRLSIIVFDSEAKHLFGLQPMIPSVKDNLKTIIQTCFTGGSTNLQSALELLIKVKNDGMFSQRPFKVIILSDGQPDSGKEGFHLIDKIYEGDIQPEIYACTFGSSVKADTLKRLLLPDNQHYYRHISSMNEFKNLVREIGLDKNMVIGTHLQILFKYVEPISQFANKINDQFIISINQIKTGEILTIPLQNIENNYEIQFTFKDMDDKIQNVSIVEVENKNNFVKFHYYYKKLTKRIKDLDQISNHNEKLNLLNMIEVENTIEHLGEFYHDIKDMLEKTRLMIINQDKNNYQHYNSYTQHVSSISSHSTPIVNKIYKKSFTQ
jgi:hypothetical protein